MKKIILTIDDGPSKNFGELLDYLIKNNHKAILFCTGENLSNKKRQKLIIKAIKNNFLIGNHSYSHPRFSLISLKKAKEEIIKTENIIIELYKKAGKKRQFRIFRFPYHDEGGLKRKKLQILLKGLGYKNPYYKKHLIQRVICPPNEILYQDIERLNRGKYDLYSNIVLGDWAKITSLKSVLKTLKKARDKDVLNLHDQPYPVKHLIKPICKYLVSNGFKLTY